VKYFVEVFVEGVEGGIVVYWVVQYEVLYGW